MQSRHLHAFSLVELSIVLVILGLLVGGVLSGQSLIRAAQLRNVSTEYSKYYTALQSFRDKYFAMPGDMNNATSFWGKNTTACNGATGSAGSPGTCNGNGDNYLGYMFFGQPESGLPRAHWQHLALAGLIEGRYTGTWTTPVGSPGVNVPASKLNGATWELMSARMSDFYWNDGVDFELWLLMMPPNIGGSGVMKAEEAWNIDTKLDDGKPGMGKVAGFYGETTCYDTNDNATSVYMLSSTASNVCKLLMKAQ